MIVCSAQYLAGVIDSDGSVSISKRHVKRRSCNYTCMIGLTWTQTPKVEEFMQFLCQFYGGSYAKCLPSNSGNYKNSKPVLKYCATGVAAERIARDVRRYVILKKKQIENLLKARSLVGTTGKRRSLSRTKKLEALYILNKQLNSKNGDSNDSVVK